MLSLLHAPRALTVAILNETFSLPSLQSEVRETKYRHLTRSDDDLRVMDVAQNLAVVVGTALLSTAVPTTTAVPVTTPVLAPLHHHLNRLVR